MISYEYYKIFYYACKYQNFTKVASVLNTSQSSVSHIIQNLERQMGCRLFIRHQHGITLTPEGERLYIHVAAGCENFMRGENEVMDSSHAKQGTIYLAATETALHCFLFEILGNFHKQYPEIKFKIENVTTYGAIDAVRSGVSDYAILSAPASVTSPLTNEVLVTYQDVLICGKQFEALSKKKQSLSTLVEYPYICLCSGTATRKFFDDFFAGQKVNFTPDIELATTDMIIPMVRNNLGLGFVPEIMLEASNCKDELYVVPLTKKVPKRSINIVSDTTAPKSLAAKAFYQFILKQSEVKRG